MKKTGRKPSKVDLVTLEVEKEILMDGRFIELSLLIGFIKDKADVTIAQRTAMNVKYDKYNVIQKYGLVWIDMIDTVKIPEHTSVLFDITLI